MVIATVWLSLCWVLLFSNWNKLRRCDNVRRGHCTRYYVCVCVSCGDKHDDNEWEDMNELVQELALIHWLLAQLLPDDDATLYRENERERERENRMNECGGEKSVIERVQFVIILTWSVRANSLDPIDELENDAIVNDASDDWLAGADDHCSLIGRLLFLIIIENPLISIDTAEGGCRHMHRPPWLPFSYSLASIHLELLG